jgi:hypothetical protein
MSNVIRFPGRTSTLADEQEIDLLTAVDIAIRDLRQISENSSGPVRVQARECLRMLERVFTAAGGRTLPIVRS